MLSVEAHYFNQSLWQPDYHSVLDTQIPNINYDSGTNGPNPPGAPTIGPNNWSVAITGKVRSDLAGFYQFISNTDDDGYLYVNGQLVSADPGGHGQEDPNPTTNASAVLNGISLAANTSYDFIFLQSQGGGGAGFHMLWKEPDSSGFETNVETLVPADHLSLSVAPAAPTNLTATVNGGTGSSGQPNSVSLNWTQNDDNSIWYIVDRAPVDSGGNVGTFVPVETVDSLHNNLNFPMAGATSATDAGVIPGQNYAYRVRAANYDGSGTSNTVVLSGPITALPQQPGVEARYYNDQWWKGNGGDPHVSALSGVPDQGKILSSIDYISNTNFPSPDPAIHNTNYSVQLTGKIATDDAGLYTFITNTDDDGYLWVNNKLVSWDPGPHGLRDAPNVAPISLGAHQQYNFIMEMSQAGGGSGFQLSWSEPNGFGVSLMPPATIDTSSGQVLAGGLLALSDVPATPTGLTAAVQGLDRIQLNWTDASSSELQYVVQRSTDNVNFSTVAKLGFDSTSYTDTGLAPNTTYFYKVFGTNWDGIGAAATAQGHTLAAAATGGSVSSVLIPMAAGDTNLTLLGTADWDTFGAHSPGWREQKAGSNQISNITLLNGSTLGGAGTPLTFSWTDGNPTTAGAGVGGADTMTGSNAGFEINAPASATPRTLYLYVGVNGGTGQLTAHLSDGSVTPVTDTTLTNANGTSVALYAITYSAPAGSGAQQLVVDWQVQGTGGQVQLMAAALGTPAAAAPVAPTGLAATLTNRGRSIQLTWNDASFANEDGYIVERSTDNTNFSPIGIASATGATGTFTDSNLTPSTHYYYRVRSYNSRGESGPSNVADIVSGAFGVEAHYYDNVNWSNIQTPGSSSAINNINWDSNANGFPPPGSQGSGITATNNTNWSVVFTGKLHTDNAGTYTFISNTDDAGYLYVNGVIVSSDPGGHAPENPPAGNVHPISLAANTDYNFEFWMSQQGGGAAFHMYWIEPDGMGGSLPQAIVPADHINQLSDIPLAPTNLHTTVVSPSSVALAWTPNNDVSSVWYEVDRAPASGNTATGPFVPIGRILSGTIDTTSPLGATNFIDSTAQQLSSYLYEVKALNYDGSSAFTTPIAVTTPSSNTSVPGVNARYFNQSYWAGPVGVNTILPNINFNAPQDNPIQGISGDTNSAVFSGKVHADTSGVYTFVTNTDETGFLWVNGVLVSSDEGSHTARDATMNTPISLTGGQDYDFVMMWTWSRYQGGDPGESAIMQWATPGNSTLTPVPADHLKTLLAAPTAPTALAVDSSTTPNAHAVDFTFTADNNNVVHYILQRSSDNGATWQAVAQADPGSNVYDSGTGNSTPGPHKIEDSTMLPGTTYQYRVMSMNFEHPSDPSQISNVITVGPLTPSSPSSPGSGAEMHWYNSQLWGSGDTGSLFNPGNPALYQNVQTVDFAYAPDSPTNQSPAQAGYPDVNRVYGNSFSSIATGKIHADTTGVYTFITNSDDDGYMFVNGIQVSADPGGHGQRDATILTPITLQANTDYNFVILFSQMGGGAAMHAQWIPPGGSEVVIPVSNLSLISDVPHQESISSSGVITDTPTGSAAGTLAAANSSQGIALTWVDQSPSEIHFEIQRSTDGNNWTTVGQAAFNSTSFTDKSAVLNTHYFYRVRGTNFDGAGPFSNTAEATFTGVVVSQTINGTAANDTITIKKNTDGTHDDIWVNAPTTGPATQQALIGQTITINGLGVGTGGTDTLVFDSSNGNPIPTGTGVVLRLNSGTGTFTLGGTAPTLDATHVVDLGTSTLILPYTGTSPLPLVQGYLKNAVIKSSDAAASNRKFAIADVDNGSRVSLSYRVVGDLNGNGTVGFEDLLALAQHYNNTGVDWSKGDLNYDGTVAFADLLLLAQHYGQTASAAPAAAASSPILAAATLDDVLLGKKPRKR